MAENKILSFLEVGLLKLALHLPISARKREKFANSLYKRLPSKGWTAAPMSRDQIRRDIKHNPLISVIVVSHNSQSDLPECISSISRQTYQNIEVILVENGRSDSDTILREYFPQGKYIRTENDGFAEANNVARRMASGEYVLLLNPDAKLEEGCIEALLDTFLEARNTVIAVPKIRFWSRYFNIRIQAKHPFELSVAEIEKSLSYKKIFIRAGKSTENILRSDSINDGIHHIIDLDVPLQMQDVRLNIKAEHSVQLVLEGNPAKRLSPATDGSIAFDINRAAINRSFWLINNAGSALGRNNMPYDRAFGQKDMGQFDGLYDVDALCGCVALIKMADLGADDIFDKVFFAYYEDSELSYRVKSKGGLITYNSDAISYHKHSTTSQEYSPTWQTLVKRSSLIYKYRTGHKDAATELQNYLADADRYDHVSQELSAKLSALDTEIHTQKPRKRFIGVYNHFWNTFGGGEVHALQVLMAISREDDEIHLISEVDFDLDAILEFAGYRGPRPRKVIDRNFKTDATEKYSVFINSTFGSSLASRAGKSLYIVSFPHKNYARDALASYDDFLFNSTFTQTAAQTIWPNIKGRVIYPTLSNNISDSVKDCAKEDIILNIGRFTSGGHAKNQDKIIEGFLASDASKQYELVLIGSSGESQRDIDYLVKLKAVAAESKSRITIIENASAEVVEKYLQKARLYIHATGLNQNPADLDLHEHFGMAVLEAVSFGAYPLVYQIGGPADLVKALGHGNVFADTETMSAAIDEVVAKSSSIEHARISKSAIDFKNANAISVAALAAEL